MRWWLHFQGCQPVGKHVAHFGQTHRSHRGHGTEIGKHAEHELGAPEHLRCQYFETLEPAAPIVFVGPGGHCFDQRQGKGAEMSKILPLTLQARNTGGSASSEVSSRSFRSYSAARPSSRRSQRSLPPMTADSTSKLSHFHGALNVPATTAWSSVMLADSCSASLVSSESPGARSESTPKTSSCDATQIE